MCERKISAPTAPAAFAAPPALNLARQACNQNIDTRDRLGSRRKRLWELASHTHCPVIGVCLPMPVLRRLLAKALGNQVIASDYEFHAAAVAECAGRRPVSELLQRELDRRFAIPIKRFSQAKTTDDLAGLWRNALKGPEIAGALWSTLTHARCDEELREQVCHDIHMFQHQVGACNRADLQRLEQLAEDNALLAAELSALKERHARMLADRNEEVDRLNGTLMRLRGQLIARDSAAYALQDELHALRSMTPALPQRLELARKLDEQKTRIHQLMQERTQWQQRAEQESARASELDRRLAGLHSERKTAAAEEPGAAATLQDKAVLCVGGRPASVPLYRKLIERTGGTFLHHDGGEEHSSALLETSLAAADLVICQTGCISHHAYWRVKDYCKRTGKQCMFVETPSTSTFARCIARISTHAADAAAPESAMQKLGA